MPLASSQKIVNWFLNTLPFRIFDARSKSFRLSLSFRRNHRRKKLLYRKMRLSQSKSKVFIVTLLSPTSFHKKEHHPERLFHSLISSPFLVVNGFWLVLDGSNWVCVTYVLERTSSLLLIFLFAVIFTSPVLMDFDFQIHRPGLFCLLYLLPFILRRPIMLDFIVNVKSLSCFCF